MTNNKKQGGEISPALRQWRDKMDYVKKVGDTEYMKRLQEELKQNLIKINKKNA